MTSRTASSRTLDSFSPAVAPPAAKKCRGESFFGDLFAVCSVAAVDEVNTYLVSSESCDNVVEFWRMKSDSLPRLSAVASFILAIPATETSSERVFSLAGRTIEDRRTQLSEDSVDALLFLHGLHAK